MEGNSGTKLVLVLIAIAVVVFLSVAPLTGMNLGLDLQGGAQVVLQAIPEEGASVSTDDMSKLTEVMRRRVDEFGVSEPIIQREGNDRLIIELAGVDNPDKAIDLIGKTFKLEFKDPHGIVILTGADLKDAKAHINNSGSANERNQVSLTFTSHGADLFRSATTTFIGQQIGIYLDGKMLSNPKVNSVIPNGEASISGGFATFEEAAELAAMLRGGSLPVEIQVLSKRTIGPTLGQDSLEKSLQAILIGMIVLIAFMLLYYRLPGSWACVSLVVYALLLMWILYLFKATLTLTSIAGFILSVGMAVDSNIIIYERIKEELYSGKSLKASIEAGFKRAFNTIIDSHLTTLIAAVVLYYLGTGSIRGFALTLSIGLIASLFTAITFTRFMLRWTSDIPLLAKKSFFGMGKGLRVFKVDYIGMQKIWYIVALVVIIPGMVLLVKDGLNLGIDFTGGTIMQVQYEQPVALEDVRKIVSGFVEQTPSIQESENYQFQIRTEVLTQEQSTELVAALGERGELNVLRNDLIGPVIGAELLRNAQLALIIAGLLMLAYITIRFQFNFAVAAVLTLVHDVLVMLSVFAILQIEVDSAFVAALLTVVGYSINNVIVVFDRIRENVTYGQMSAKDLVNASINQTFTRSVNTVLAVMFLLFSLLIFGGDTTKIFILALIIGITAGFYSSLCLAGNFLEHMTRKSGLSVGKSRAAVRVRASQSTK
jgi:SecD/SecF fusion protein